MVCLYCKIIQNLSYKTCRTTLYKLNCYNVYTISFRVSAYIIYIGHIVHVNLCCCAVACVRRSARKVGTYIIHICISVQKKLHTGYPVQQKLKILFFFFRACMHMHIQLKLSIRHNNISAG